MKNLNSYILKLNDALQEKLFFVNKIDWYKYDVIFTVLVIPSRSKTDTCKQTLYHVTLVAVFGKSVVGFSFYDDLDLYRGQAFQKSHLEGGFLSELGLVFKQYFLKRELDAKCLAPFHAGSRKKFSDSLTSEVDITV